MSDVLQLLSFGDRGWGDELLYGAGVTLALALTALPLGLGLGLVLALAKFSRIGPVRFTADTITTIFRAVPELLTLFIVYYGSQVLIQSIYQTFGLGPAIEVSRFGAGVTALSLVFAAYSSEVMYGAMLGVGRGQTEAAHALGLGRAKAFVLVVLPQMARIALPGLGNNWLMLLKDTSLVSVIALQDLMRQTSIAVAATKQPIFFFAVVCFIYFTISALSGLFIARLESRLRRGYAPSDPGVARR